MTLLRQVVWYILATFFIWPVREPYAHRRRRVGERSIGEGE